jgi:purine-binding chemotaxis protein CheW
VSSDTPAATGPAVAEVPPAADVVAAEAPAGLRACVVSLGNELFAVEISHAREVVVLEEHTTVPLAPPHLVGIANLRGQVLPIVDVRPLLGLLPRRVGRGSRVLVVATGPYQVGMAVDGVVGLEVFGELVPLGAVARRQYGELSTGFVRHGDRLVALLDTTRALEMLRSGDRAASPIPDVAVPGGAVPQTKDVSSSAGGRR